jgi:hypothetical protein
VLSLSWLQGLIRRRPLRLIGVAVGISVAVALFATLGLFLAHSKATMTDRAIAEVPVDWQVKVATDADPAAVLHTVSGTAGVSDALPVGYAQASGLSATTGATTQTTGAAMVLGLPDGYATAYPKELRTLIGAPTGVLIAQQTAANLHVGVGDVVTIERSGLPPVDVTIQGVTDLPAADSLFQDVGATTRAAPTTSFCYPPPHGTNCSTRSPRAGPTSSPPRSTPASTTTCPRTRPPPTRPSPDEPRTSKPTSQGPEASATTWPPASAPLAATPSTRRSSSSSWGFRARCSLLSLPPLSRRRALSDVVANRRCYAPAARAPLNSSE